MTVSLFVSLCYNFFVKNNLLSIGYKGDSKEMKVWDKGIGEPIVFIHGIVGDHRVFSREFEALSTHYRVISYDYSGHGEDRGKSVSFSMDTLVSQVHEIFTKIEIDKAHLCTLSFGSYIANAFAARYPEKVFSLCHIGGHYNEPSWLTETLSELWKVRDINYSDWIRKYAIDVHPYFEDVPKKMTNKSREIFYEFGMQIHPSVLTEAVKNSLFHDSKREISGLHHPILWVMGEYDFFYKSCLTNLHTICKHVEYKEIPKAGHVAHKMNPEVFENIYRTFLKKLSRPIQIAV